MCPRTGFTIIIHLEILCHPIQMALSANNSEHQKVPGRNWEVDDALAVDQDGLRNRNFERG